MKYTKVYQQADMDIVITVEPMRSVISPRSYEEKLMDGATKKSYRKSHRYGNKPVLKHDYVRGKTGR